MKNNFQMLLDESNALAAEQVVGTHNAAGDHRLVLVCEHASNWVPPAFRDLGLDSAALSSHAAWDPGALGVAENLASSLDAPLVFGRVSRLVYDCNRPPDAADAILPVTEAFSVPGNTGLTDGQHAERVDQVYRPFQHLLEATVAKAPPDAALVTVHSFTPVYCGQQRTAEIGILHGEDPRLALTMMALADRHTGKQVRLNEPYGPQVGGAHTLDLHGCRNCLINVMSEIRNDLIETADQQAAVAGELAGWLRQAIPDVRSGARP